MDNKGFMWKLILIHLLVASSRAHAKAPSSSEADVLMEKAAELRSQLPAPGSQPGELSVWQADQYLHLATTLQRLNHLRPDGGKRIAEAEKAYLAALGVITDRNQASKVRGNLGALLLEAGRAEEAVAQFDHSLSLVRETSIMFNRAKALGVLGSVRDADDAYSGVAQSAYGSDLQSFGKSIAAMELMDDRLLETAESVERDASRAFRSLRNIQDPDPPRSVPPPKGSGWWGWSKGPTSSPPAAAAPIPVWLSRPNEHDLAWINFGIYKAKEKRKQYSGAWAALERANRYIRSVTHYNHQDELRTLDMLLGVFKQPFGLSSYMDETPIFVVGLPRSGSTLVEQMLSTHTMVWGAGEDTALAPLTPEVNQVLSKAVNHREELGKLGLKYVTLMRERAPSDRAPPLRIVDKMLRNLWLVGYIDLLVPRARIVHVMRHPLDAGLSCYAQPFGYNGISWAWDLKEIAEQIMMTHRLADFWDATHPGRVRTVFYEELIQYPREVAAELVEWAGLPWEEDVLNFHKADRPVATASLAQVRKPLYNSSVARWRRYEQQLEPLRLALGGTIQKYETKLDAALERRRKQLEEGPGHHGRSDSDDQGRSEENVGKEEL